MHIVKSCFLCQKRRWNLKTDQEAWICFFVFLSSSFLVYNALCLFLLTFDLSLALLLRTFIFVLVIGISLRSSVGNSRFLRSYNYPYYLLYIFLFHPFPSSSYCQMFPENSLYRQQLP